MSSARDLSFVNISGKNTRIIRRTSGGCWTNPKQSTSAPTFHESAKSQGQKTRPQRLRDDRIPFRWQGSIFEVPQQVATGFGARSSSRLSTTRHRAAFTAGYPAYSPRMSHAVLPRPGPSKVSTAAHHRCQSSFKQRQRRASRPEDRASRSRAGPSMRSDNRK